MKKLKLLLIFISFSLISNAIAHPFAGGDGTILKPYQISTAKQLDSVRRYLGKNFILINDIDLGVAPYNSGEGWIPIGTSMAKFTGSFHGHGHIIRNLFINRPTSDVQGLFGYIYGPVSIDSLGIENCSLNANNYLG